MKPIILVPALIYACLLAETPFIVLHARADDPTPAKTPADGVKPWEFQLKDQKLSLTLPSENWKSKKEPTHIADLFAQTSYGS